MPLHKREMLVTLRQRMTRNSLLMLSVATLVVIFTSQVFAKEITVRGRLQRTVEPGGWVISSDDQKYLVLNARRFKNEKWFVEGAEVEAIGKTKSDVMTTHMEGTPFEVRTMRPFVQGGPANAKTILKASRGTDQSDFIGRFP
jgi:hypothetical protein